MSRKPDVPTRLDVSTLLRAPEGVDEELLGIFLKYNDVLLKRGIGTYNIWMKRAHYLYGLGRFTDAIDAIQEALVHEPLSSDAHFLMGVCLQLMALEEAGGNFEDPLTEDAFSLLESASLAFEATLDLNPGDDEASGYLTNIRCLLYDPSAEPKRQVVDVGDTASSTSGADVRDASAAGGSRSGDSDAVPVA